MTLPNFLICGAQKAGTTALYTYLDQHPDIFMSPQKEIGFFHDEELYTKGLEWLACHFDRHKDENAIGEASPLTMASAEAPARIAKDIPKIQLIFLLRNPIERAYSHYNFSIYTGNAQTNAAFHEIIRDEACIFRHEMIERGRYATQLARFDQYFAESQMKVILQEDLRRFTRDTVQDIFNFLEVDTAIETNGFQPHNLTLYARSPQSYYYIRRWWKPARRIATALMPKSVNTARQLIRDMLFTYEKPAMHEGDRIYLKKLYADQIERLEERLNRDLSHWT